VAGTVLAHAFATGAAVVLGVCCSEYLATHTAVLDLMVGPPVRRGYLIREHLGDSLGGRGAHGDHSVVQVAETIHHSLRGVVSAQASTRTPWPNMVDLGANSRGLWW